MKKSTKRIVMYVLSLSLIISACDRGQIFWPMVPATPTITDTSTFTTPATLTPRPTIMATPSMTLTPTASITPTPIGGSVGRLAFEMDGNTVPGKAATFLINSNGSNLIKIPTAGEAWFTSWFPDGKKIIYQQGTDSYIINMENLSVEKIQLDIWISQKFVSDYQVSPDGSKIAFVAMNGDETSPRAIYVANFDGVTIRNSKFIWRGIDPVWSPDGSKLAFTSKDTPSYSSNGSIQVINPDGSHAVILTLPSENLGDDRYPSWSPDGTKIAFYAGYPNAHKDVLFIMNSDGSNVIKLAESSPDESAWPNNPAWSPDGQKIAYIEYSKKNGATTSSIYLMDVDGTNQTMLFDCSPNICQYVSWDP